MRKRNSMPSNTENFSASHLDRKSLKGPDLFSLAVTGFIGDFFRSPPLLIGGLVVFLLAGGGVSVWTNQTEAKSRQATGVLYEAEKLLEAEMKKIASSVEKATPATSGQSASREGRDHKSSYLKMDVDTQLASGVAKLKEVTEKFPKTRASFEAQMQLGSLYFDHGQSEKALEWFQRATGSAGDRLDRVSAFSSVGYSQENLGRLTEALASFQKAISYGDVSFKGDLLLAIARCYVGLHDSAKARSIYEQVSKEFPGGEYSKTAEALKGRL